jgi:acetylornithine/N-succinyldiaminopimelate aminotransferase
MPVAVRPTAVMKRGQGSYLWDEAGQRYLDFVQGWAVNALGHAASEVSRALAQQAAELVSPSPGYHNAPCLRLAQSLVTLSGLYQAHLCTSGAEANEAALKLARKWGRRHRSGAYEVITATDSFHGRTLALMAASGKPGWDRLFPPNMPGFRKVTFGDADAVRRAVGEATAAIMVEPIQGEAGVVVPPPGYLRQLRQIADEYGLLLICDEVQTGIGRTGTLFGFEHDRVAPDILTLGKGLGAGVPISAVIANARASVFEPGDQGGTHHGNPLSAAVALAVLEVVTRPEFLRSVCERGRQLEAGLNAVAREYGAHVRGRGLLWALALPSVDAERVRDACFERGLLVNAARPAVLRFMPQLRVSSDELQEMLEKLGSALKAVLG